MSEAQNKISPEEKKQRIIAKMISTNNHLELDPKTGCPWSDRKDVENHFMENHRHEADKYKIRSLSYLTPLYEAGIIEGTKEREEREGYVICKYLEYEIYKDLEFVSNKEGKKELRRAESYWWVEFSPRTGNEPADVTLSVNGETLVIKRQEQIPIPQKFLLCCDNTIRPVYENDKISSKRKIRDYTKTFMYSRGPRASREDYERFKRGEGRTDGDNFAGFAGSGPQVTNRY